MIVASKTEKNIRKYFIMFLDGEKGQHNFDVKIRNKKIGHCAYSSTPGW
jgi:hypothetical protein